VASSTANATHRINLKLGYAHPILIPIPEGITVTTPQPTRIVLQGVDKQKLGLFAAMIRRWRKPEPYRGKVSGRETVGARGDGNGGGTYGRFARDVWYWCWWTALKRASFSRWTCAFIVTRV
jgi:hypothetical protein